MITLNSILRSLLVLMAVAVPVQTIAGEENDWSLEKLIGEIAAVEVRSSRFVETKELAILDTSLTQTGTLDFHFPDRLSKRLDPPDSSVIDIAGDTLSIQSPNQPPQYLSIANHPQLGALLEPFRAILAGDLKALRRYYRVSLKGERTKWKIELHPVDSMVARRISTIEIYGAGPVVNRYLVLEANGDRTTTSLESAGE